MTFTNLTEKQLVSELTTTASEFTHVFSAVRVFLFLVLCVCFVDRCLSFGPFSFGHCVVCSSSIYGFWFPIWNLQTLLWNQCISPQTLWVPYPSVETFVTILRCFIVFFFFFCGKWRYASTIHLRIPTCLSYVHAVSSIPLIQYWRRRHFSYI